MQDVQNSPAQVPMPIDSVGVRNLTLPILVSRRDGPPRHTVATVELGVELPARFKGTHMSRFIEVLENWNEDLSYKSMKSLLERTLARLEAQRAQIIFSFPYFLRRAAPVTGAGGLQGYNCRLTGELAEGSDKAAFVLEVCVPVMTVCPCSKAISDHGAHSQRAEVRMALRLKGFDWMEEFIELAENSASSPTFPLLKREDEKFVTEQSFARPCFVEDVVRNVAEKLEAHPRVSWFRVEVESYESIHAHNAYARIERHKQLSG
ncbi:GTP cyclohydrolase FolE2 [Desulfovibrio sp. OttesenSCG-928-G11]|nr:GTP cyclohydrolase FolE2 [Desulfovibrio sp. OttesenSCG-928-G11]